MTKTCPICSHVVKAVGDITLPHKPDGSEYTSSDFILHNALCGEEYDLFTLISNTKKDRVGEELEKNV